ncbi:hypothetical protein HDU76_007429 [Blyttiomyces sp. JEL0837]|nr:hypothetical protein HDU76_007429 [Blyttiomyces sp. JEL0837]
MAESTTTTSTSAISPAALTAAIDNIYDLALEQCIMDVIFEVHREEKMSRTTCQICHSRTAAALQDRNSSSPLLNDSDDDVVVEKKSNDPPPHYESLTPSKASLASSARPSSSPNVGAEPSWSPNGSDKSAKVHPVRTAGKTAIASYGKVPRKTAAPRRIIEDDSDYVDEMSDGGRTASSLGK